jgi:hypothetical protein
METSIEISVNNARCHLYGICEAEARGCPMRAVSLSFERE